MILDTDQACFLKVIRANPADDLVRLVYADWLEEHGHDDEASLIRIQCEAYNVQPTDPDGATKLAVLAGAMVKAHAREWARPLYAAGADNVEYYRGILEGVWIRDDRLDKLEQLLEACPPTVHRLRVQCHARGDSPAAEVVASCPSSQRLDQLDLARCFLSLEGLRALTASDHLNGLAELGLHGCGIDDDGVALLAYTPCLPSLRYLNLRHNHITAGGVRVLVDSPMAEQLTHLDVSSNWISDEGVEAIVNSQRLGSLSQLVLQDFRGGEPWGVTWQGMLQLTRAGFPPDMSLEFGGYKGTFAMFQKHPSWFVRAAGYDMTR